MAFRFSDRSLILAALAALASPGTASATDVPTNAPAGIAGGVRGMWVWNTEALLGNLAQQSELAETATIIGVTDLYLYVNPSFYADRAADLAKLITRMGKRKLKVWATDGCRCYLSDADGPGHYLAGIDGLIGYNNQAAPWARFVGFQADIEPHDLPAYKASFHNGIASSKLSTSDGGVWKKSAAEDREALLEDWIAIQQKASAMLHARHLRFGAAMPWWTEDYNGEPLTLALDGQRVGLARAMMGLVDDYVIMSYNTDAALAADHVAAQAALAATFPAKSRPRVSAAMETHRGIEVNVSYADTPGKQSKAIVLADMAVIQKALERYPAFAGVSIEDWTGFHDLPR